jgi:tetratricopeptide (TPR) repeat protein
MLRPVPHFLALLLTVAGSLGAQSIPPHDASGAIDYFQALERVQELVDADRLAEAEEVLDVLVGETPDVGELWYRLAEVREMRGDARQAAEAFQRSLEEGYRFAPRTAYRIARLYANEGDGQSALDWLERALQLRWDDRPSIAADPAFSFLREVPRFRAITGVSAGPLPPRDDLWRHDLDYLVAEAKRMHADPDRPAHSQQFQDAADSLRARIGNLSNDRIVLEMGRLLAMLGDGHTGIYGPAPNSPLEFESAVLPLVFYEFNDGLFVINASEEASRWIGSEVLAFGDVPAEEALDSLNVFMHHDNAMTVKWLGVHHTLPSLTFLRAIGAASENSHATLTFRTRDGRILQESIDGGPHAGTFPRKLIPPPEPAPVPLYLERVEDEYWLTAMPERGAIYFQFNQVRNDEDGVSLEGFADSLRTTLERSSASHLIIDVRHNNGGNSGLVWPLVRTLSWWEMDEPGRTIHVIVGRNTFSAAQNFINRVERFTDAIFVGEPSSSSPNFTGEETNLTLPHSRVIGSISNRTWQESDFDDERAFIPPDVPVGLSSSEYFSGSDPALEVVFAIIDARSSSP